MSINRLISCTVFLALCALASISSAAPDRYLGDTGIYVGTPVAMKPNVVLLIDNNRANDQSVTVGAAYDGDVNYPVATGGYTSGQIYKSPSLGNYNSGGMPTLAQLQAASGSCPTVAATLKKTGYVFGYVHQMSLGCVARNAQDTPENYYLGDKLNWDSAQVGGTPTTDIMAQIKEAVVYAADNAKGYVKLGLMGYGNNNQGGTVWYSTQDVSAQTMTGSSAFETALNLVDTNQLNSNQKPIGELLYDAGAYLGGRFTGSGSINATNRKNISSSWAAGSVGTPIASPMEAGCQKNVVILISRGGAVADNHIPSFIGNISKNADGTNYTGDSLVTTDDVARYMTTVDQNSTLSGDQFIQTYVVEAFTTQSDLMVRTANSHNGKGMYFNVTDKEDLKSALMQIVTTVIREANTGFVAPVVPASPENRSFTAERIYLGFFFPKEEGFWYGNLKKFALSDSGSILDINGVAATENDGGFKDTARSYWSTEDDGGEVNKGGVGGVLKSRNLVPTDPAAADPLATAVSKRNIYTYFPGTSTSDILSQNGFTIGNANLTTTLLGVADTTARNKLISFVHGLDAYDEDTDTVTNEKREWVLGDILHSKPMILNYKKYAFTAANEVDANQNKTYIFVGANDGMLHCFRDRDGVEEWAFVPPGVISNLKYIVDGTQQHTYFVDGTPTAYIHDADGDGNIETNDGDKVIVIFGMRRGEGTDTLDASLPRGSYYALDVSDPTAPKFLWQVNSQYRYRHGVTAVASGMGEMGETWSNPRVGKVKIGSVQKVVAVFGAGYDNNEDLRWGSTQTFPSGTTTSTSISTPSLEFTQARSSTGGTQLNPKGRGIYVMELASLSNTGNGFVPDFTNSGSFVWGYTHDGNNGNMDFSFPGDPLVLDKDANGFIDKVYMGDTGGRIWKFDLGGTATTSWTSSASMIFSANPGGADPLDEPATNGRKFFFKADTTGWGDYTVLYIGSGDREHATNYLSAGTTTGAVLDRLYAIRDIDAAGDPNPNRGAISYLTESHLVDVTENQLQQEAADPDNPALQNQYRDLLLNDNTKYGWFIRLDTNLGEKVLANGRVFNNAAFFTTYTPYQAGAVQTCEAGNPGTARLYAVKPDTGEAVFNFYSATGSDSYGENQSSSVNKRAMGEDSSGNPYVLRRADRSVAIGGGIPTPPVYVNGTILVGADSSFPMVEADSSGTVFPVYWMQW